MSNLNSTYEPNYIVTPGDVLDDYLDDYSMSQVELSERTGLAKKTINAIINAKASISTETAIKFEKVLGRPAHFWNNLELLYKEDLARLEEKKSLSAQVEWLNNFPLQDMIEKNWIGLYEDKYKQLKEVLKFYRIASIDQWENIWGEYQVAYRKSKKVNEFSISAWLQQGEIEAQNIECHSFNKKQFQKTLKEIRSLTLLKPEQFIPRLIESCSQVGVAVVFLPELKGTGVSGCTRWIGDKAVIQLSLRYKSNDQLWFTFFHEAGHIIKHGKKEVFLEGNGMNDEKENEANEFAKEFLIPEKKFQKFLENWDGRALQPIKTFAESLGIAPGIAVGRLQRDDYLPYSHGNRLKVFYKWQ
ncbi:HigA family addiction module antidote protein [Candidatus Sulfurimonas marisnigri]|uniref:HigA family addiction module antidote protein n=1 Tax=Candidatus Sulfurimonas marisnigri TaxID=2740405 RepID=A0A7S7M1B7_9BACT|nr:HigA family addiction module antitoxin [Candidatus Sulfurimonas marisnigri]QOY55322.1 HigA family addiction module antidote protein [Candidatus Sulfurimonas marisnigri]